MEIYNYNDDGFLLRSSEADESPLEEGVFLIPRNATSIAPPTPVDGQIRVFKNGSWGYISITNPESEPTPEPAPPTPSDVNKERDRRVAESFVYDGVGFDLDNESKARITGAATLAGFAIIQGAQPGDLGWSGSGQDFMWITHNNTLYPMDAQTCFLFGKAAAAHEAAHIFAARYLKDLETIPSDYATNASYWP